MIDRYKAVCPIPLTHRQKDKSQKNIYTVCSNCTPVRLCNCIKVNSSAVVIHPFQNELSTFVKSTIQI